MQLFSILVPCARLELSSIHDDINGYYKSENQEDGWTKISFKHENKDETIAYSERFGWTVRIIPSKSY